MPSPKPGGDRQRGRPAGPLRRLHAFHRGPRSRGGRDRDRRHGARLGRQIKTDVEALLEPSLGRLAALAGTLRGAVADRIPKPRRRAFWDWVFKGPVRADHARGSEARAARALKSAIAEGVPEDGPGRISLVGAGPGARDLITLRAVRRLQEADVIFYDRLVDPDVLELARRDAERVFVGKAVGANAWPQDRINALIVAEARKGLNVVRLKSGDPGIFGRAEEEIAAAKAHGLEVEIVPGVTAASAAAAALGAPLTARGETDRLLLCTATCRDGDPAPDFARLAIPGTTLAIYMGRSKAPEIRAALLAAGWPATTRVRIVREASQVGEARIETTLAGLGVQSNPAPCIILVTLPKSQAVALSA